MKGQHLKNFLPRDLSRALGKMKRRLQSRLTLTSKQKECLLKSETITSEQRELLTATSSRIFSEDRMYTGNGEHYFRVGLSAIHCIDEALRRAATDSPRRILGMPCGGGRVLRFLVARFPKSKFTACDVDRKLVDFCAREFGANPVYSQSNFDEVTFAEPFDLIWCGSLVTHLNRDGIVSLWKLFDRHLRPGGLVVFTTHGDYVAERIPRREFDYLLTKEQTDRIGLPYAEAGYGFEAYEGLKDWGVSLTSRAWIRARIAELGGWREVYFKPRGWDDHQDVFAFVRE